MTTALTFPRLVLVRSIDDNDENDENTPKKKRLDVAIVGYPNAGKSQLLNAMLGTKVAAVSRKRHTTRNGILGVSTDIPTQTQLVFCDTPGFMTSVQDKVGTDLSLTAKGHMANVDYSLIVIDAAKSKLTPEYMNTISALMWNALQSGSGEGKFGVVLNKVDLVKPKTKLLETAQLFGKMADQMILQKLKRQQNDTATATATSPPEEYMPEIFYTCARHGTNDEGVQDVLQHLRQLTQDLDVNSNEPRDWLLPDAAMVTPMDYQARVEELIREKLYRQLHREVPHQIRQRNRQCELIRNDDDTDNSPSVLIIHQDLLVRTKAHLQLLQKSGGGNLQRIHDAAVPELRELFQCEVLLTLTAKLITRNRR